MRTFTPKPAEVNKDRVWHVIDATDVVLGRLASQTAILLRARGACAIVVVGDVHQKIYGFRGGSAAASGDALTAPMQGTIVKLAVEDGATVSAGDTVVVLEAMKMELALKAPRDGSVAELRATVGEFVEADATLAVLE